jgi:hypothetical protein
MFQILIPAQLDIILLDEEGKRIGLSRPDLIKLTPNAVGFFLCFDALLMLRLICAIRYFERVQ